MNNLKEIMKNDYKRHKSEFTTLKFLKLFFKDSGFRFTIIYRLGNFFEVKQKKVFSCTIKLFASMPFINKLSEISFKTSIGEGLYLGHFSSITINPQAKIGCNCNIHKGVTIGQSNRGKSKGVPIIGDNVWIGINSTIVGGIKIGSNVLIAPNSYVNIDVPSNSIVIGNPAIIKESLTATEGYINRTV